MPAPVRLAMQTTTGPTITTADQFRKTGTVETPAVTALMPEVGSGGGPIVNGQENINARTSRRGNIIVLI